MRRLPLGPCLLALLSACGGRPLASPAATTSAPPAATAAPAEVDRGAFLVHANGELVVREAFTLRQVGDRRVLSVRVADTKTPPESSIEGELETDARGVPVRAAYRRENPGETTTYTLGGAPLALEVTSDDDTARTEAAGPVAVFVAGPGLAPLGALCAVTGDVVLPTIGEAGDPWAYHVQAYRGAPVGALQRIVVENADRELELLCDGERLIAGGMATLETWFVREGHAPAMAALQAAPRPAPRAWPHPVVAHEPWDLLHTYLADDVIVTRDRRTRVNRLTAYDVRTGAQRAQRDIAVRWGGQVMCEALPQRRLACTEPATGFFRVLDAVTLADVVDLAPALLAAAPEVRTATRWEIVARRGEVLTLAYAAGPEGVAVDVAARTVTRAPRPADDAVTGLGEPSRCARTVEPMKVGRDATWSIVEDADGSALVRTVGGKAQPPIRLAKDDPSLLACPGDAPYVTSSDGGDSALARFAPDGRRVWDVIIGASADDVRVVGDTVLVTTRDPDLRVMARDARTGRLRWAAKGSRPVRR